MIVYINSNDNRSRELIKIMNDNIIEKDINKINTCDLVFLGKDGKDFYDYDFKGIVITLLKDYQLINLSKIKGFKYDYLYHDEIFVNDNTCICNEALLADMIIDNHISLFNSRILILGYGHCGRDLSKKLANFKAKITISDRNIYYRSEVVDQGYRFIKLDNISLDNYDFIINTIPSPIIDQKLMNTKEKDCKIYDIASFPYGLVEGVGNDNYYVLKQLPTKYAYQSSAKILYQAILRIVKNNVKE